MDGPNDEELVRRARDGDTAAFGVLFSRHRPVAHALCRRVIGADADDAVQEAALEAWLSLDRLRQPDRFGPWLAGIALNVSRRMTRARARSAVSWDELVGGRLLPDSVDPGAAPDAVAEAAELRATVRLAVGSLPPGQRTAVALHYLADLPQRRVADALGVEPGAVKARLHKARRSLRATLGPLMGSSHSDGGTSMVTVRVAEVLRTRHQDGRPPSHLIVLQEGGGSRQVPVWMGEYQATHAALQAVGAELPRPQTYGFAAAVMAASGATLQEVRIDRVAKGVYYATAVVDGPGGRAEVDARPSDALNLAMMVGAPIRVEEAVFAEAAELHPQGAVDSLIADSDRAEIIAREWADKTPVAGPTR